MNNFPNFNIYIYIYEVRNQKVSQNTRTIIKYK